MTESSIFPRRNVLFLPEFLTNIDRKSCLKMINTLAEYFSNHIHALFTVIISISNVFAILLSIILLRCPSKSEPVERAPADLTELPIRNICHLF